MPKRTVVLLAFLGVLFVVLAVATIVARSRRGPAPPPSPGASASPELFPSLTPTPTRVSLCLVDTANASDGDGDRLPDAVEETYGTNQNVMDTDGDSHTDGEEVRNGYDPRIAGSARLDSDLDGLLEHEECQWRTDPFTADTDGDGFTDGDEVRNGFDPTIPGDGRGSDRLGASPSPGVRGSPSPTLGSRTLPSPPPIDFGPLPVVRLAELTGTRTNTVADLQKYVNAVDTVRAPELTDGQTIAAALSDVLAGRPQKLAAVRTAITRYEGVLRGIPTPPFATSHHRLLISLMRYTNDRLGQIERAAGNQGTIQKVAFEMQSTLLPYTVKLQEFRLQIQGYLL